MGKVVTATPLFLARYIPNKRGCHLRLGLIQQPKIGATNPQKKRQPAYRQTYQHSRKGCTVHAVCSELLDAMS